MFGHGHNYRIWAGVEGPVDPAAGMFMNLVELDAALDEVIAPFDHRFINVECAALLRGRLPTSEVLTLVMRDQLGQALARHAPADARLAFFRLAETPELWAEVEGPVSRLTSLTRSYTFSAAHVLALPNLDEAENRQIYGKCANPLGHGHDYRLDVTVAGEPDPVTGMVVDLSELDAIVGRHLLDAWDHRHLNYEVPAFAALIPTTENVVRVAWDALHPHLGDRLAKLTLHETPRGSVEYRGESA